MDYTQIKCTFDGHIATVTLARPERLNAFTAIMQVELCDALDRIDADPLIRAVIVTGEGRGFCAGADLSGGADTFNPERRQNADLTTLDRGGILALRLFEFTKPTIAAINGPAVGIGVTMTLPMDIRIASESASFGFSFGRRGIVVDGCASWFLPRIVGISRAIEWCTTGRTVSASAAMAAGLVSATHEPQDLLPAACAIADEIATSSAPVSNSIMRGLLWRMLGAPHPSDAHVIESRLINARGLSGDAKEGIASFLQKRSPEFAEQVPRDFPAVWHEWLSDQSAAHTIQTS